MARDPKRPQGRGGDRDRWKGLKRAGPRGAGGPREAGPRGAGEPREAGPRGAGGPREAGPRGLGGFRPSLGARPGGSMRAGGSGRPRPGPFRPRHGAGFGEPGSDTPTSERTFGDTGARPRGRDQGGRPARGDEPFERPLRPPPPGAERPPGRGARPKGASPRSRPDRPSRPSPWARGGGGRFEDHGAPPPRPGAPAPPLAADEELVAGRRPVEEAFAAGRPARRLLVTPQRRQALEKIVLHATTLRIPIVEVEGGSLTALAGFDGHQGVAVVVEARRFASVDDILARALERSEPAFVLVLDSLEDPQNVGTLLRSAEASGVHGVLFPTERQAPLTPAAIKASAGATEHLLLAPVEDLAAALTDLHLRGLRVVGSDADAALSAREADLRGPTAIVVGSEGHGLSPAIRRRCDVFVRIPMKGAIGSLNAAVAGSILLFEALGQRDPGARPAKS